MGSGLALTINHNNNVPPPYLTHYTDLTGFMGIVGTGQFWASNVSFLNDRQELLYGLESALQAAQTLAKKETYAHWRRALEAAVEALKGAALPNTYAACFCGEEDALSQWRGYGGQTQGIALVFAQDDLTEIFFEAKAELYKVTYGNLATSAAVKEQMRATLDELDAFDHLLGSVDDAAMETHAIKAISKLLPRFKHRGFKDEREYRYVIQHQTVRSDVCFRVSRNVLAPYLKMPVAGQNLPLRRVTVGPGHDQALTRQSVQIYLRHKGYENVEVRLSDVPFRT
ncbi:hypothetical protein DDF65_07435 [Caulobacter radicis]|uniref:DUF2971 domain-containing protein n=1 Tax=Caulobacter radicis TaxID=2172650 RepID=A0A2T9JN58_9CAUL|nr:hypothetical protein DDF65_07435 [Caulobacter radicis]